MFALKGLRLEGLGGTIATMAFCTGVILAASWGASGCSDAAQPEQDLTCPAGQMGCPCALGNTCHPAPDGRRLSCSDGFCVPADDCPRGSHLCACYANGTCDPLEGVPMTCAGNLCVETIRPDPGQIGGECHVDDDCQGDTICLNEVCVDPACPLGELGCQCGAYGYCEEFHGEIVRCVEDRCQRGSCDPGTFGCECGEGETCFDGMICDRGICFTDADVRLTVGNPNVRSCDLLLDQSAWPIGELSFAPPVRGQQAAQSPRLALSFIAREDQPFEGEVLSINLATGARPEGSLQIVRATCYDQLGRPVDAPQVQFE